MADQLVDITKLLRGRKPGLRKSRPSWWPDGADFDTKVLHRRAYYVWRIARFHGGVDMHMPVAANMDSMGDPALEILDTFALRLAKANFGTATAALEVWGGPLGL